jgi:hypothetical protein
MRKRDHKKFMKLLRELREMCPTVVPVRVRREPCVDVARTRAIYDGDKLSHFTIVIDPGVCWEATCNLLLHEWAHALSWVDETHPTVCDHDVEWGIAMSRVYSEVIEV